MSRSRESWPTSIDELEVVQTDDGSRTLRVRNSKVTWHSESGALAESKLVFLKNSGVHDLISEGKSCRVFEVGFGTGLNFWITASHAIRTGCLLEYNSLENRRLPLSVIEQLGFGQLDDCQPAYDLFAQELFGSGLNNVIQSHYVTLILVECQLSSGELQPDYFDAVYHDPFGPDDAPEFWTEDVFRLLNSAIKNGGRLVTYCCKSNVQRTLKACGFEIEKTRGPIGGKREVLIAHKR